MTGHGGVERVEHHGRRICVRGVSDDLGSGPGRPDPELVDRGRPEGVGGGEHDPTAVGALARRELADRGRLARPVDADDERDRRPPLHGRNRLPVLGITGRQQTGQLHADGILGRDVPPGTGAFHDVHGQHRADISRDQRLLDLVPVGVASGAEGAAQPCGEACSRAFQAMLELLTLALPARGIRLVRGPVGTPCPLNGRLGLSLGRVGSGLGCGGLDCRGLVGCGRGGIGVGTGLGCGGLGRRLGQRVGDVRHRSGRLVGSAASEVGIAAGRVGGPSRLGLGRRRAAAEQAHGSSPQLPASTERASARR